MDRVIEAIAGLAAAVPRLAMLVARLARDPRVPVRAKRLAAGMALYAALPIDLVPDLIPVVGVVDDVVALVVALAILVESAPDEAVVEHWDGKPETLARILVGLGIVMDFLPRRVRWIIRRLVGE